MHLHIAKSGDFLCKLGSFGDKSGRFILTAYYLILSLGPLVRSLFLVGLLRRLATVRDVREAPRSQYFSHSNSSSRVARINTSDQLLPLNNSCLIFSVRFFQYFVLLLSSSLK